VQGRWTAGCAYRARGPRALPTQGPRPAVSYGMKLIVAMVQVDRIEQVLRELYMNEIYLKTISLCTGHGRPGEAGEGPRQMFRLEIAVNEAFVRPTLDALLAGAHSGEKGDGKIFILPLEGVVRIRNGDTGPVAIG